MVSQRNLVKYNVFIYLTYICQQATTYVLSQNTFPFMLIIYHGS